MKKMLVFLLAFGLCSFSLTNAQPNNSTRQKPKMGRGLVQLLNLTSDQEKQFHDIMFNQREKAIDARANIQKNRLEVGKMIHDNNFDESQILKLTDASSKLQGELRSERIKSWLAFYKILNADQKETLTKHFGMMLGGDRAGIRGRFMQRFNNQQRPFRMQRFNNRQRQMGMNQFYYNEDQPGMQNFDNDNQFKQLGMLPSLDDEFFGED